MVVRVCVVVNTVGVSNEVNIVEIHEMITVIRVVSIVK